MDGPKFDEPSNTISEARRADIRWAVATFLEQEHGIAHPSRSSESGEGRGAPAALRDALSDSRALAQQIFANFCSSEGILNARKREDLLNRLVILEALPQLYGCLRFLGESGSSYSLLRATAQHIARIECRRSPEDGLSHPQEFSALTRQLNTDAVRVLIPYVKDDTILQAIAIGSWEWIADSAARYAALARIRDPDILFAIAANSRARSDIREMAVGRIEVCVDLELLIEMLKRVAEQMQGYARSAELRVHDIAQRKLEIVASMT